MIDARTHSDDDQPSAHLAFRRDSAAFAVVLWSGWMLLAIGIGLSGFFFLVRAVTDVPAQPAEAAKGLFLAIALAGAAGMFAGLARPGLSAAWAAHRNAGSVVINGDHLILKAPGLLDGSSRIERAWVKDVKDSEPWPKATICRLTLALGKPKLALEFTSPICPPNAIGAPQQLRTAIDPPPAPWLPMQWLILDLEDPLQGASALHRSRAQRASSCT